jgi:membrane-bound metal-dependent hydrolase YbcI (DUF457 family)
MTGKTHVLGGMTFALGGFLCMKAGGMLIPDVAEPLQLGIIMPYAIWSSTLPDLDQAKESVAQSSPINLVIQKIFTLVGAGHRSVKSHVIPMLISLVLYLAIGFGYLLHGFNGTEITIIGLMTLGIFLGLLSHFILDIMTRKGIKVGGIIVRVVPDTDLFGTGTLYENIVRKCLYIIVCIFIVFLFL